MHVRLHAIARRVDPAAATAWWSDFRDGPHDHRFVPGSSRAVVERGAAHATMVESVFGLTWEHVTAWPGDRHVRFVGTNKLSRFSGTYRFEPDPHGTRVVLEADIHLAGPLAWTDRAAKPMVQALLQADLRGHAKEMERDLAPR
ncbi:MAG TPA: SRPBCC family protein [Candidatus Thermoplasmatota archaeon]|nr:SRPBCC family protein [Candidatus Thermoplasmatota archaeon]